MDTGDSASHASAQQQEERSTATTDAPKQQQGDTAIDEQLRALRQSAPPGTRVVHGEGGHKGTVRVVEALSRNGPRSVMLGVEWDGPHGMNDGSVNGVRYFTCAAKHGSFVVPSRVHTASSLEDVLLRRFTEDFAAVHHQIDNLLSKDPSYRDVSGSFVNVWNVDCAASHSLACVATCGMQLSALFPNIRRLSIPNALLSSWRDVATIVAALSQLETFNVRSNKLGRISTEDLAVLANSAPPNLVEFNASYTGIESRCVGHLLSSLPGLHELHVGGNPQIASAATRSDEAEAAAAAASKATVWGTSDHAPPGVALKLHTINLSDVPFEDVDAVAHTLGAGLVGSITGLNLNKAPLRCLRGLKRFSKLEKLLIRDCALEQWDDLLPVHDHAPTLRHLCFSSESLDGKLDTGHLRRQHVVAMMPQHVSHLNLSFIRESEWRAARQAIMTNVARDLEEKGGSIDDADDETAAQEVPELMRRLIREQREEGVEVFVPKPRHLELELNLQLHILFCPAAVFASHVREYFRSLATEASLSEAERRRDLDTDGVLMVTPRALNLEFTTPIRQSVGSLREAVVAQFFSDVESLPLQRLAALSDATAADIVAMGQATLTSESPAPKEKVEEGTTRDAVLLLFHLDGELLQNPGAAARGFHMNELFPPRPPLHNWRMTSGDHLVAVLVPDGRTAGLTVKARSR